MSEEGRYARSQSDGVTLKQRTPEFSTITESPCNRATSDQLSILHTRYAWAAKYAANRDVLEVACGAGVGLGRIAQVAHRTVGGDIDECNCAIASETYHGRREIEVMHLDAEHLPFPANSFDLIILFEAIYYLNSADAFFREARRLLRPNGLLLISSVNCRWKGFNHSPFSTRYYEAAQLAEHLADQCFAVSVYGAFPETVSVFNKIAGVFRKAAVRFHLIPRTQRRKEWLKRIFYGKLKQIPRELQAEAQAAVELEPLESPYPSDHFRFIYWAAQSLAEPAPGKCQTDANRA